MMPNRLAAETSPYLLQHANNPVDWYPWGPEALAETKRRDVPILLSIGYAACHWCHVMERESFEDAETARLMNERFVPVKVDREERPDLDSIYMDAVQAMTGHGGWPMTVFLTPEGVPFYAGTYFPNEDRHGLPAFTRVLEGVAEAWRTRRDDVAEQGQRVIDAIDRGSRPAESNDPLTEDVLRQAHGELRREVDPEGGGFFSSQDADSEGREGTFYVWTWDELVKAIGEEGARSFGARPEGNWEGGRNILWTPQSETDDQLAGARDRLFEVRQRRVRPGTDDKVLASWNGLAVLAFAEAGRIYREPRYVSAARDALRFLQANLLEEGRLRRSWREGRTSGAGYLDDYALVGLGALALYETAFDGSVFGFVRSLADALLKLFRDPDGGGFFQTAPDAEELVVRPRELFD